MQNTSNMQTIKKVCILCTRDFELAYVAATVLMWCRPAEFGVVYVCDRAASRGCSQYLPMLI